MRVSDKDVLPFSCVYVRHVGQHEHEHASAKDLKRSRHGRCYACHHPSRPRWAPTQIFMHAGAAAQLASPSIQKEKSRQWFGPGPRGFSIERCTQLSQQTHNGMVAHASYLQPINSQLSSRLKFRFCLVKNQLAVAATSPYFVYSRLTRYNSLVNVVFHDNGALDELEGPCLLVGGDECYHHHLARDFLRWSGESFVSLTLRSDDDLLRGACT